MDKNQFNYIDLSPKELELLKDIYIHQKVNGMNHNELKDFATENITLQIKSTIGKDEELEAWQEMEEFFKDEFETTIKNIKIKFGSVDGNHTNANNESIKFENKKKEEDKKLDMWED